MGPRLLRYAKREELALALRYGRLWCPDPGYWDVDMPRAMCQWFNETDEEWALSAYRCACDAAASAKRGK